MAKENVERGKTGADDEDPDAKPKKINLSGAQVAGGALASVTAAVLGSYLGLAGTVLGAGMTSIVITVGGALYQRSLESTKQRLETTKGKASVALKRTAKAPAPGVPARRAGPGEEATRKIQALGGLQWPGGEQVERDPDATRRVTSVSPDDATRMLRWSEQSTAEAENPVRRIRWGVVAATSALVFGIGMLVITGLEGVTGRPLSGGDGGTTVGRVLGPGANGGEPTPAPQPETATPERSTAPEPTSSDAPESSSAGEPAPPETDETTETGQSEAPRPSVSGVPEVPETAVESVPQRPGSGATGESNATDPP
ncbi:hypothetical protein ACL03H_04905 [Saccharopolyspora sp. MS10]|uniref:hypothetical protein n=1 Tax=Saccharopolyspora sp. MS10 TaxID=3385973 RepID=UPI0039A349D1